jgi:hypothetical protein
VHSYIDHYIGEWKNEAGNHLIIRKIDVHAMAEVSFYSFYSNKPVFRSWYNNKPSINMIAKYFPADGPNPVVDVWKPVKEFYLYLNYEPEYVFDVKKRDAIVPTLCRYEEDEFLVQFYKLFEPLKYYIKI